MDKPKLAWTLIQPEHRTVVTFTDMPRSAKWARCTKNRVGSVENAGKNKSFYFFLPFAVTSAKSCV